MGYPVSDKDRKELRRKLKESKKLLPGYVKATLDVGEFKRVKESFSWITPEWRAISAGKKTVKVKGVALTSDIVSKNRRKYLDEELKMAARTLAGRPITLNHIDKQVLGNVIHAEYENGAIEYLGQIKKEPFVSMLKARDPKIKGVSVQAGYIHNACVKCGERFFSEKAWKMHMEETHGIIDGVAEVHGIVFDALSLVVDPETKGVPTATIELMETDRDSTVMRLFETVLQAKVGDINVLKLGEPASDDKEEVKDFGDVPECEEGKIYNPVSKQCEPAYILASQIEAIARVVNKKQLAEIYKAILEAADNAVVTMKDRVQEVEGTLVPKCDQIIEMLRVLKTVYVDNKAKQINETTAHQKRMEALETRLANLEFRQKGRFKGGTRPDIEETEEKEEISTYDPYKSQ